ncbi:hypothetical protein [Paraburkholderia nodosa]|uniref:hypothetical protein n=1 Tax=Paraburkholderia nodosa TaxID=392320 RepID=UPI0004B5B850|nr:hypothetical protein [Paraburkholderia nodosa]
MIISPPFLPDAGLTSSNGEQIDPMMDAVDQFELAHGIYPIAFDRRWHTGVHLMPATQNERVRAIADGEVVAYRVCQKAIDGGSGKLDSNAGFVLLKHQTETGEGRSITFYSLYMHLLELDGYTSLGVSLDSLAEFLRTPSPGEAVMVPTAPPPAQSGAGAKVYRKDVLGLAGRCHGQNQIHFEIFMLPGDFDAYFGSTQLDNRQPTTPAGTDYWGHSYFVIPADQTFKKLPDGMVTHNKPQGGVEYLLNGVEFVPLQDGTNTGCPLHVESWFHKGDKFTSVWSVAQDGTRTPLTSQPVREPGYEYNLYNRAKSLYPGCPSDGYELLRFGRILSTQPVLATGAARTTWMRITFDSGNEGYVDVNSDSIIKLSDADFPFFAGWEKLSQSNGNTPFKNDGMCDVDQLKKIVRDVAASVWLPEEPEDEDALCDYVRSNDAIRTVLKGFVCHAPTEWDGSQNESRYAALNDPDGFYGKQKILDPTGTGYSDFLALLKKFQFWDKTGLTSEELWFFHPLKFIRHFRKCGWLSVDELSLTFPRYLFYSESGNPRTAITTSNHIYTLTRAEAHARITSHVVALNNCIRKYLGPDKQRISIFLAQVLLETAQWRNLGGTRRLLHEWGFGQYSSANPATQYYTAFYGRGIMQLTWAGNYREYGDYRKLPDHSGAYVERLPSAAAQPRITSTSQHYTANPADGGQLIHWAPRFDPDAVAEDYDLACDSGGFYWVSKSFSEGININRVADRIFSATNVGFVSRLVNGGFNGYYERHAYSLYIAGMLMDSIVTDMVRMITPPHPKSQVQADLHKPE